MKPSDANLSQNGDGNANGRDHHLSNGAAVKFARRESHVQSNALRPVDFRPAIGSEAFLSEPQPCLIDKEALGADTWIPCWKRILDLTCIWITFPIWSAAMALVSVWILAVSPGPLLYQQDRIGYRGRRFRILKFRTMKVNVETKTHEGYFERLMETDCPMTKLDGCDARLIRGGRLLRALAMDELAQIFNVIRGEMSLVGPRPCTPHEFARFQPAQKARVNAPPGLTGYWQVNGKNKTTFSQMIAMDIFYAKHMSPWMDVVIMLKTIPVLAMQMLESHALRSKRSKVSALVKE